MNKDFININQELPESINYLSAMRYTYSKAKFIRLFRLIITFSIPVISIISLKFFPSLISMFSFFSSIWLILDQVILIRIEDKKIENAAKIQELFDVSLFNIGWNKVLVGDKPLDEDVFILSQKFRGDKTKLKSWYQGLKSPSHFYNVLLAQRTNVIWDKSLRKFYSNLLVLECWLLLFSLVTISFFLNVSFQTFILSLLVPLLPLLLHLIDIYNSNKQRYQSLETMTSEFTDQVLKDIATLSEEDISNKCRQYQDYIYLKRCDSPIPDVVYWIKQNTYDKVTKKTNEKFSNSL